MGFQVSPCVGIIVPDPPQASSFYQEKLGMNFVGLTSGLKLAANTLRFFLDPGRLQPPVLELLVPNLEEARTALRKFGFEEASWQGPDKANLVVDPFGIRWNIYHAPNLDDLKEPHKTAGCPVLAKIGIQTPFPVKAADFYAELLELPLTTSHNAWFVDGRFVRLRFEDVSPPGPVFYLHPDFDLTTLDDTAITPQAVAMDPYGIRWKRGPIAQTETAVVQTVR